MLKKFLTYFEMLIVRHALQCVDGCFFVLPHLTFCFWHTEFRFKFFGKIHMFNIKVVVFVLKKVLTYFEMLIVPHALYCVDICIFVFTSFDTVWHTVLVSVPPPPLSQNFFIRFSFFVKIHLLESSQLEL